MRTFKRMVKTGKELRSAIENCLEFHEKYKGSYFWGENGNGNQRSRNERRFQEQNPGFDIETPNGLIQVRPLMTQSRKNTYYSLTITVDGEIKDIRALKKLL
jgi:hypothetical protein